MYILYNPNYLTLIKCVTRFSTSIFSCFEPIWALDKQAKVFSNSVSISPRYSITKFEKFDSAVCLIQRSANFRLSNSKKFSSHLFFHDIHVHNSVSISPRYSITKFEKFDSAVCLIQRSANFRLSNLKKISSHLFFHDRHVHGSVFTPKRISLDCPFKSNQRLTKISILTPRCDAHRGVWLCGMMHTA